MKVGLPGFERSHWITCSIRVAESNLYHTTRSSITTRPNNSICIKEIHNTNTTRRYPVFLDALQKRVFNGYQYNKLIFIWVKSSWIIGVFEPCNIQATSYLHIESNRNRGIQNLSGKHITIIFQKQEWTDLPVIHRLQLTWHKFLIWLQVWHKATMAKSTIDLK